MPGNQNPISLTDSLLNNEGANFFGLPQNFLMGEEMEASEGKLEVAFASLRSGSKELHLKMEPDGAVALLCDDLDVVGDVVQALSDYLALEDLASTCEFPDEIDSLGKMLVTAEELQSVRQRLSAEMADHSGMIRTLVVRAEDSRLMMDM